MNGRLLQEYGAAATASQASRIFKHRYHAGLVQLSGKMPNPLKSRAIEYYWFTQPLGRLFPHEAMVANLGGGWRPDAAFFRKQFGVGKDALIPDAPFRIEDSTYYLEYCAANEPLKVWLDKFKRYGPILDEALAAGHDTWLLIVTHGERRVKNLVKETDGLGKVCVAELGLALAMPWGKIWHRHGSENPLAITRKHPPALAGLPVGRSTEAELTQ